MMRGQKVTLAGWLTATLSWADSPMMRGQKGHELGVVVLALDAR
jgi:hypothetical protein